MFDGLFLTPWPMVTWFSLICSIFSTFLFVPFWLKRSDTVLGMFYREMIDDIGEEGDQEDTSMVIHSTQQLAKFVFSIVMFCTSFSVLYFGSLSAESISHADSPATQFMIAISLGYNIYYLIPLFIMADWTDRIKSFFYDRFTMIRFGKIWLTIYALQNMHLGYFMSLRYILQIQPIMEVPMFLSSTIYSHIYGDGMWSQAILLGFMMTLPIRVLVTLIYWYKVYFYFWSESYAVLSFTIRTIFLVYPAVVDFYHIKKIFSA